MFARLSLLALVVTLGALGASATDCGGPHYTVASGDICQTIAQRLGISVDDLKGCNPSIDANCTNLQIGQSLASPAVCGTCVSFYTVKSGDVCWEIAQEQGITVDDLYCANPGVKATSCTTLQIGQELCIIAPKGQ
ncbi:carbohydrate-binding module family 50 protein [Collybiopsis luxurians FD-317 M1]|uniref:Carbohydrate-binding module family 50 protein n=1 Tax=Collybiopsis luxurians FD-317 M1 TaxID=944289 RepID=A0A0D0CE61_9AGAR|nr:carbohydrate-binding module family 50 protein [Collybiopsis luxurians FD-317 M1]